MTGQPGRSGRLPKPTQLKVLHGNPGKRQLNENEPKPETANAAAAPEWLDDVGREFWDEYAPELVKLGLLTLLDVPEFAAACEQHSLHRKLMKIVMRAPAGKRAKELEPRARHALSNRDRILARFGFDPSSRSRLSVAPQKETDELERLMQRKAR
jgi:P27 family predicted phage terminase small subunit